jgi:hypothetical protein
VETGREPALKGLYLQSDIAEKLASAEWHGGKPFICWVTWLKGLYRQNNMTEGLYLLSNVAEDLVSAEWRIWKPCICRVTWLKGLWLRLQGEITSLSLLVYTYHLNFPWEILRKGRVKTAPITYPVQKCRPTEPDWLSGYSHYVSSEAGQLIFSWATAFPICDVCRQIHTDNPRPHDYWASS